MTKILHNPRCQKSRETLKLLIEKGESPDVIEYLKQPPSKEELMAILKMLGIEAEELVRKGEADYKTHYKGKELSENDWLNAMLEHPKLIERPIVLKNGKAAIGRPPSNVLNIL